LWKSTGLAYYGYMKLLRYIRYFYFIATQWNLPLAWHIIRQEVKGEQKYGIDTTGADDLQHLEEVGISTQHATLYMPVSYDLLEQVFGKVNLSDCRHFLDIGCGKGRALCMAAHHGFKRVTGIDFSAKLCRGAEANLRLVQQDVPDLAVEIIQEDAFDFAIPPDVDCVFLFNPFDGVIMHAVVENILQSLRLHPRRLLVIYVNPQHGKLFLQAGFTQLYHIQRREYLEAVVMVMG
jgi:SAM-dependent methyltransferase